MKPFVVVGYYTRDTLYEGWARAFVESLKKFSIPYYVEAIANLGDWYSNTHYKPTFIKKMLKKFPEANVVYVDCDAKFFAYPTLFEELSCDIGVHYFDRSLHGNKRLSGFEVLSGTIFLENSEEVYDLVSKWGQQCRRQPFIWDQKALEIILEGKFYNLPEEYCTIFDIMKHVKKPVIVHYQASREVRKNKGRLRMKRKR